MHDPENRNHRPRPGERGRPAPDHRGRPQNAPRSQCGPPPNQPPSNRGPSNQPPSNQPRPNQGPSNQPPPNQPQSNQPHPNQHQPANRRNPGNQQIPPRNPNAAGPRPEQPRRARPPRDTDFGPTGPITGGPAAAFSRAPEPPDITSSRRRWINAGRVATAITSSLVLAATGIAWTEYEDLASGLTTSSALRGAGHSHNGAVNVLLIGLDSRKDQNGNPLPREIMDKLHAGDGNEGGYNTNTLILLHVPGNGGPAKAFSIPRDDQVPIPGEQRPDKIKKAYGLAKAKAETRLRARGVRDQATLERRSRDAGRRATLDVVRTLTGQPIDHFAEVNLAGFYDLASALGGVPVCLNHPVSDDYSGANFSAGRQMLNASQALSFVRQRHGLTNGDLDRTHRQQAFLTSVASKLRSSGTFTSPGKMQGLLNVAKKDVVIDSDWDVLSFAQQAPNLTGGTMQFQTLPIQGYGKKGGEEVNLIDPVKIRSIVRAAFDGAPPPKPAKPSARAMGAEGAGTPQEPASTVPQSSHLLQSPQTTAPAAGSAAGPAGGPAGGSVGGADVPCVN